MSLFSLAWVGRGVPPPNIEAAWWQIESSSSVFLLNFRAGIARRLFLLSLEGRWDRKFGHQSVQESLVPISVENFY